MQPPIAAELLLFARVLMHAPRRQQGRLARSILVEATIAGRHREKTGQCHRQFGDGSLMARCFTLSPGAEPFADDPDFLRALAVAADALLRHANP